MFTRLIMRQMKNLEDELLQAYTKYADAIYRHCFFRVYDKDRAEELTQETFTRTWDYMTQGKEIRHLRAFLYRIANNLIIDYHRKKKEDSLERLQESGFDPANTEIDMTATIDAKQALAQLQKLEAADRQVLIMRYIDQLSPREIAKILDLRSNTVSVRINRALQKAKKLYESRI